MLQKTRKQKNRHQLIGRSDPYDIKMDLLDQPEDAYSKFLQKCGSYDNFIVEKTSFIYRATGENSKIHRDSINLLIFSALYRL